MWRALRLVIDTGIHQKHWNREQAIALFKANTAKSDIEIENEVDRYIAWPGQSLAYKLGQLKITELRRLAEQKLGARFDIREFHDLVLASGPIPLDVLTNNVERWLATK
jgi:prolyl oligopeptidase